MKRSVTSPDVNLPTYFYLLTNMSFDILKILVRYTIHVVMGIDFISVSMIFFLQIFELFRQCGISCFSFFTSHSM